MNNNLKKNKLQGKKPSHRNAVIKSLVMELIRNERIKTTPRRAKILKSEFDRLVTEAKKNTDASMRNVENTLQNNDKAVIKLTQKILPRLADVNSGYTHSANTLPRKGDSAPQMVLVVRGAEFKEKKTKLQKALEKRTQTDSKNAGVASKIKDVVAGTNRGNKGRKHESQADTRRVST